MANDTSNTLSRLDMADNNHDGIEYGRTKSTLDFFMSRVVVLDWYYYRMLLYTQMKLGWKIAFC